jgi:signal transduction histidine kinase
MVWRAGAANWTKVLSRREAARPEHSVTSIGGRFHARCRVTVPLHPGRPRGRRRLEGCGRKVRAACALIRDRSRSIAWPRALAACCALFLAVAAADEARAQQPARAKDAPWRVVLLRGWDSLQSSGLVRETAMREAITDHAPHAVEFFPEEVDPLRFPDLPEDDLAVLLHGKYRGTPIDLVVASGKEPLDFAARHRDRIWPGAAIVYNGVYEGALDGWTRPPRTTGVTLAFDVEGTVSLGRALVPDARKLYVFSGTAPFDVSLREIAAKRLAAAGHGLEVVHVTGLTRAEMVERAAELEGGSLLLYLSMLRDGTGQVSPPGATGFAMVAASASVPVLTTFHPQLAQGAAGGSASRLDLHGRAAGQVARRVLDGVSPESIDPSTVPAPRCEVDWKRLQRWRVPDRNVPARCAVLNDGSSSRTTHLWQILGLVAIIVLQAGLLWSLVLQSRRRRLAEANLYMRSAELAQQARLSMMGALTASIAHEINQPMGAILSNTEAAQMMLDQGTLEPDKLVEILADVRNEVLRASDVIRSLRKLLTRGQTHATALELNSEVAEALGHVAFEAARRGTRFTPVLDGHVPAIIGDSVQLQQVVINLVMNAMDAVAHLPEDQREIRIETRPSARGAEVAVADRGVGVSAEDAARLFRSDFTTKKEGMGFGLSIVRGIVEMHRGRVWYEPNVPRGAIFHVWLPSTGT